MPRAAGLAAELKREFDVDAELIKGSGGVFDVTVDGKLVFSKYRNGDFPKPGEVVVALRQASRRRAPPART